MATPRLAPRTVLFLPASNPRAIAKARTLGADLVVLDLEDAVAEADKDAARAAAIEAIREPFGDAIVAVRINGEGHPAHGSDMIALERNRCDYVVVPKVESAQHAKSVAAITAKRVLAMIETPRGVLNAAGIANESSVDALIAGTNDLRASLRMPADAPRSALAMSLQLIVLAARAHGCWAIDGVCNALSDPGRLAEECRDGRTLGFDGKSLIHPDQIAPARAAFAPTPAEVAEAEALIAAHQGGASRFRDRMIEAMHVAQAKAILARAERA